MSAPPGKEEAPQPNTVQGLEGLIDGLPHRQPDFDLQAARDQAQQQDKDVATIRALLALGSGGGYTLHILAAGDGTAEYLVSRWNRSRSFKSVDELREFARAAGGYRG